MAKINIVLDLDGVIANIVDALDDWLHYTYGVNRDICDYSNWLIADTNDKEAMDIFNNPIFWKNMKPYEDAWHQVNKWFSNDVNVHIVTARRCDAAISQTFGWLDSWHINTLKPVFTNIYEKHNVIKEINPKFVVEDNPHEVKILRENGVECFLRKQWYNEQYWGELPTIDTLYDLEL